MAYRTEICVQKEKIVKLVPHAQPRKLTLTFYASGDTSATEEEIQKKLQLKLAQSCDDIRSAEDASLGNPYLVICPPSEIVKAMARKAQCQLKAAGRTIIYSHSLDLVA